MFPTVTWLRLRSWTVWRSVVRRRLLLDTSSGSLLTFRKLLPLSVACFVASYPRLRHDATKVFVQTPGARESTITTSSAELLDDELLDDELLGDELLDDELLLERVAPENLYLPSPASWAGPSNPRYEGSGNSGTPASARNAFCT